MWKPALLFKTELEKQFAAQLYTTGWLYYSGYPYNGEIPKIEGRENLVQLANVDVENLVRGYLSYTVDPMTDTVNRFGLYSFDPGNPGLGRDLLELMERLYSTHARLEWSVVEGNPVKKHYDWFAKSKPVSFVHHFHACTKDLEGNLVGTYTYEVLNPDKCGGRV